MQLLLALLCLAAPQEKAPLVITDVDVLDLETGKLTLNQGIVVEDGVITWVGTSSRCPIYGAARIDGGGYYLIPGLIDARASATTEEERRALLASGVTTALGNVRAEGGGAPPVLATERARVETPGTELYAELTAIEAAGTRELDALRAAISEPAAWINAHVEGPPVGKVEVGYQADFVILTKNPLEEFTTLAEPRGVFADGAYELGDILRQDRDGPASDED